jgi:hypothetical protein
MVASFRKNWLYLFFVCGSSLIHFATFALNIFSCCFGCSILLYFNQSMCKFNSFNHRLFQKWVVSNHLFFESIYPGLPSYYFTRPILQLNCCVIKPFLYCIYRVDLLPSSSSCYQIKGILDLLIKVSGSFFCN